jgi:hypothetical protein
LQSSTWKSTSQVWKFCRNNLRLIIKCSNQRSSH